MATTEGDIIYKTFGLIPDRNAAEASYTKKGNRIESVWKKVLDSTDLPHAINPDKGYFVSGNNFIGSSRLKNGILLQRTFPTRAIRMNEMLNDLIATKDKKITV